jgi:methylglyoxal synthase
MEKTSMKKQKRIALIAHDNRKQDLVDWVKRNRHILSKHFLCGTGTTAKILSESSELPVKAYKSGPLGGDQQIGARIAEGDIDIMIFFWDPLTAQPHDPDVKALLRIAVLYDIPVAMNHSTADFLLNSVFMDNEYDRDDVMNYNAKIRL